MGRLGIRGSGAAVAAAVVIVLWHGQGFGEEPAVRGAGSCSATACHGGTRPGPGKVLRNEHTVWVTRDRHADAFRVLTEGRSRAISARLPGGRPPAEKDERCLACHATPVASPASEALTVLVSDGVGCESCHGPSGRWIVEHTRGDWPLKSLKEKAEYKMTLTVDLARRAKVCTGCHVGEPAHDGLPLRDVDHDLIAAGHPRLNFEFSAYFANVSHHWRDDVDRDAAADFPARAWLIGQVVTARAALDLLQDRARRAGGGGKKGPSAWPEFTEYGCFSCHHDLRDDPWRRQPLVVSTPPGRSRWGSWHYPLLEVLADADRDGKALTADLDALRRLMDGPSPEPAEVARLAGVVSGRLGKWLDRLSGREFDAALVRPLDLGVSQFKPRSWDEATQRYLARVPLTEALQMLGEDLDRTKELTAQRTILGFPEGHDSPKGFDPSRSSRP